MNLLGEKKMRTELEIITANASDNWDMPGKAGGQQTT